MTSLSSRSNQLSRHEYSAYQTDAKQDQRGWLRCRRWCRVAVWKQVSGFNAVDYVSELPARGVWTGEADAGIPVRVVEHILIKKGHYITYAVVPQKRVLQRVHDTKFGIHGCKANVEAIKFELPD